ncbi:MAG: hypothetical protein IJR68_12710 [Fretibacterium sp.]|nr:hypothetical protein [Fretibacterium sp.]
MRKLFRFLKIAALALCLVVLGAMSPMTEPGVVWGDDDPKQVVEVFRTGKCKRYSDGFWDYWGGIITGRKFEYCPCIPMDLGELTDFSQILSNLGTIFKSLPGGFWKGEIDLAIKTKDPHLEDTMKKVWNKHWVQDAGARELVIQAEAMVKSIQIARSAAFLGTFNAILNTHQKYGVHGNDFRKKPLPKDVLSYLQVTYTGITPMNKEEDRINAYLRRDSAANILGAGKGSEHYDSLLNALDALYNELINDDGEKDPFGNITKLYNDLMKLIDNFRKVLDIKGGGWTQIPALISGITTVMNDLKKALEIGGFGFNKRMVLYQVLDALLDDVVKNWKVWTAAVLDKNPTYPIKHEIVDGIKPVLQDLLKLLFVVAPEKGQTKMLQLATAMADQQSALTELNEYAILSFHDRKMVLDQAKNSKKAAIQSNVTTIAHDAANVGNSGKSHKIGF